MADSQSIVNQKSTANTPAIIATATALAANRARSGWMIANTGMNALYVLLGTGASTTVFHLPLKASTGNDDGTGGTYSQFEGTIYTGVVSVAGTSPRYVVTEIS